jgi:uncharacterized membrane protein
MIKTKVINNGAFKEFILCPNSSMPWKMIKKIYLFFFIFIFIISSILCYLGLYLAIPFYGIEVLLLGYVLYFTCLKSTFYQIIKISSHLIEIKTIQGKKICKEKFNRDWSKFRLVTTYFNRPSYIVISSHGRSTRIGDFLCESERLELFKKIS